MTESFAWEDMTPLDKVCTKELCEQSLFMFSRAMFRFGTGGPLLQNWHQQLICDELEKVYTRETQHLILNVAPGSGKTELVSVSFPAWCFAKNPKSRTLMVSYSSDLVNENSSRVRDYVQSTEYHDMFQLDIANDTSSKSLWKVSVGDKKVGEFKGSSSGSAIMGFRAGRLTSKDFAGGLILDDPSKPADMLTEKKRAASNQVWANTASRMARSDVPYVLIMQRVHSDDATGFKLSRMKCIEDGGWYKLWQNKNGVGHVWRQVIIPALIDQEYVDSLPEKYRCKIGGALFGADDKGRFSYWPAKQSLEELLDLEYTDPFMFAAQYQQKPIRLGGDLMPETVWRYYSLATHMKFDYRFITADTALTGKKSSDPTVIACWGVFDGKLYLIDAVRGRWESPRMHNEFLEFVNKHNNQDAYPLERFGTLRAAHVERAASGFGLVQQLANESAVPLVYYAPNPDGKVSACFDTLPFLQTEHSIGRVYLPEDMESSLLGHWVYEHAEFTTDDSHDHDDCCDNTFMAVTIGLRREQLQGNGSNEWVGVFGDDHVFSF